MTLHFIDAVLLALFVGVVLGLAIGFGSSLYMDKKLYSEEMPRSPKQTDAAKPREASLMIVTEPAETAQQERMRHEALQRRLDNPQLTNPHDPIDIVL